MCIELIIQAIVLLIEQNISNAIRCCELQIKKHKTIIQIKPTMFTSIILLLSVIGTFPSLSSIISCIADFCNIFSLIMRLFDRNKKTTNRT